jgi:hypothetical protein
MQCSILVFDGLLQEPHNTCILKLLFNLAHWHTLAKLRMHTDTTLDVFSKLTTSLGCSLHEFEKKTCSMFQTLELKREQAVQQQRQENNIINGGARPAPNSNARKLKCLNLKTYKYHALGDYVSAIQLHGTMDSYSTQSVSCYLTLCLAPLIVIQSELEHRKSKACFVRTSGRLTPLQLSKIE